MRNILTIEVGGHSSARLSLLKRLMEACPSDIFFVLDQEKVKKDLSFRNCIFIDYEDVFSGNYKNTNWELIPPLDIMLLNRMCDCETEFYYMLNRYNSPNNTFVSKQTDFDKRRQFQINRHFKGDLSFNDRQRLYYRHLRYWSWFLKLKKIDLVIYLDNAPHFGYDYIIYHLCKLYNIKVILSAYTALVNYKVFINDFKTSFKELKSAIKKIDVHQKFKNKDIEHEYYRLTCPTISQDMPKYMYNHKRVYPVAKSNLINKLFKYINFDGIDYLLRLRNNEKFERMLNSIYEKNIYVPEKCDKYIYVPLHFQPEMTSSPMGGRFANQLLQIEYLSHAVPSDILVYVKEHPKQELSFKGFDFYNDLIKLRNVKLIPRYYSNYELLENCIAVSSLIGTAGWEGLFKGKPFIMFGHHFYKIAPGVFVVNNLEECRGAINAILKNEYWIDKEELKRIMLWLDTVAVKYDINNNLECYGKYLKNLVGQN